MLKTTQKSTHENIVDKACLATEKKLFGFIFIGRWTVVPSVDYLKFFGVISGGEKQSIL